MSCDSYRWPAGGRQISRTAVALAAVAILAACGSDPPIAPGPIQVPNGEPSVLTTVQLSLADNPIELGQNTTARAVALDQFGAPIDAGAATYASSEPATALVNPPTGQVFPLAPGTVRISGTIGGKTDSVILAVVRAPIRINEITPNGDAPGGWVELFNPTAAAVDMSGWTLGSSDLREEVRLPAGTLIPAVGYLVVDEVAFPFGLRAFDSLHIFSRFRVQVDSHFWGGVTSGSFARCPDGAGPLVLLTNPTRGAPNECGVVTP